MNRREFVRNSAAAVLALATPTAFAGTPTKEVRVLCATNWQNATWVVFDDLPSTIFRFDHDRDDGFQPQKGDKLLVTIDADRTLERPRYASQASPA